MCGSRDGHFTKLRGSGSTGADGHAQAAGNVGPSETLHKLA